MGGAATLPITLRAVRDGGHVALVGLLGGERGDPAAAAKEGRGIRVDSVYVGSVRHFEALNAAIAAARMRPVVDRVFRFEDAPEAYERLRSAAHFGKIVIAV